jgi:Mg/Co/Ni transporter MgtE
MSPRAACRLERFGFTDVVDYAPGKAAWLAAGLPSEGRKRPEQRIGAIAKQDVPLLDASATVGGAASAFGDAEVGVVVDAAGVVLGLVRRQVLGLAPETAIVDVAQPGPSTFRPSMTIREMIAYFEKGDDERALVTTLDGVWIGIIRREDLVGES